MPDHLCILLDQNLPPSVATWLRKLRPRWAVWHTSEVGLAGAADPQVFRWAQQRQAVIVTFDEDFADQRAYPLGSHHGIVRLRVFPTTTEQAQAALGRLIATVSEDELRGALTIVDRRRIRLQPPPDTK